MQSSVYMPVLSLIFGFVQLHQHLPLEIIDVFIPIPAHPYICCLVFPEHGTHAELLKLRITSLKGQKSLSNEKARGGLPCQPKTPAYLAQYYRFSIPFYAPVAHEREYVV
jgi:hypothetical protein